MTPAVTDFMRNHVMCDVHSLSLCAQRPHLAVCSDCSNPTVFTLLPTYPSMPLSHPILQELPDLPPSVGLPWPAEVIQAHRGLQAGFRASQAALNLDESDPIRLGHHLHQAKTAMVPVVEALRRQKSNPLPSMHIEKITMAIFTLVNKLQSALAESTAACVTSTLYL